ncbi:MAG: P-loop NTPase [Euryarchaeota archaeon]|nr:P-loop NTPase [Euryarchaeota archaeon]
MDPRLSIIGRRMEKIKKVIAVSGGKGGIGKSSVASLLSLNLSEMGYRVGLLDMDFCGPSTHVILGIESEKFPEEEKGVIPPTPHGIKFMSVIHYAGDNPSPLRGSEVSNALIELLAVTLWGELDFLIIDMPPGMGDAVLDTIRLIKKAEFLVVTTPSKVALETVKKMVKILNEQHVEIVGVIENMKTDSSSRTEKVIKKMGTRFLGEIRYDNEFENTLGKKKELLKTEFSQDLKKIIENATDKSFQ